MTIYSLPRIIALFFLSMTAILPPASSNQEYRRFQLGNYQFQFPISFSIVFPSARPGDLMLTMHGEINPDLLSVIPRSATSDPRYSIIISLQDRQIDLFSNVSRHFHSYSGEFNPETHIAEALHLGNFVYFVGNPMIRKSVFESPIVFTCSNFRETNSRVRDDYCRTWYSLDHELSIQYIFPRSHLRNWSRVDRAIRDFISSARLTPRRQD